MPEPQEPSHQAGKVVCHLKEILALANIQWKRWQEPARPVTLDGVARSTGLNRKTVQSLANQRTTRYDLHTLAALCWYFGCQVGDLLEYVPHGSPPTVPSTDCIKREAPPAADKFEMKSLLVQSHIVSRLEAELRAMSVAELSRKLGLPWSTISQLAERRVIKRIDQHVLIKLCHYFQVDVHAFLHLDALETSTEDG